MEVVMLLKNVTRLCKLGFSRLFNWTSLSEKLWSRFWSINIRERFSKILKLQERALVLSLTNLCNKIKRSSCCMNPSKGSKEESSDTEEAGLLKTGKVLVKFPKELTCWVKVYNSMLIQCLSVTQPTARLCWLLRAFQVLLWCMEKIQIMSPLITLHCY